MTAVDKENLHSASYVAIFNIIDDRTNIADPRSPSGGRIFVYDFDPFITSYDFSGYPYIYLAMPRTLEQHKSVDHGSREIVWSQRIIIRSSKDGAGHSGQHLGREDILQISDDLNKTFYSSDIRADMRDDNLLFMSINQSQEPTDIDVDGDTVFESVFELMYRQRIDS